MRVTYFSARPYVVTSVTSAALCVGSVANLMKSACSSTARSVAGRHPSFKVLECLVLQLRETPAISNMECENVTLAEWVSVLRWWNMKKSMCSNPARSRAIGWKCNIYIQQYVQTEV